MNTIRTQKGIPTPAIFVEIHAIAENAAGCPVAPEAIGLTAVRSYGGSPAFAISYTLPGVKGTTIIRMPISLTPSELAEVSAYLEDLERRAACQGLGY